MSIPTHDSVQALSDIASIPMPDDDQGYPPLHPLDGSEDSIPLSDGDLVAIFEIFNDQQKSNPSPDPLAELDSLMDRIAALPPSERPVAKETALAGSVAPRLDSGSNPMPNDPQSYPGDSQGPVEMSDLEGCNDIMLLPESDLQAALDQLSREQIDRLYSLVCALEDPATPAVDQNALAGPVATEVDSGSVPMPNDPQSYPGEPQGPLETSHLDGSDDFIPLYEQDVDAVSESLQDEPPELCAISESSFNGNEELQRPMTSVVNENALAAPIGAQVVGSDHHEPPAPQQGASTGSQDVQNTQTTFPTLGQFTAPVPGLPQLPSMGASQYHPPQPPAVPQAPLQGYGWSQNGHYVNHYPDRQYIPYPQPPAVPQAPLQGRDWSQHAYYVNPFPDGRYNHYPQPPAIPQAPPQGPGWPQHGYQAGYYAGASNAGPSTHNAGPSAHNAGPSAHPQPYTAVVPPGTYYPNVAFSQGQNAHLQTGPSGGTQLVSSSSAPDGTASVKSRKRKAQPVDAQDGSSGSSLVQKPRKRRRPDDKEIKEGKFGVYSLADASAIVMARPVHDPKPFDGERRTHDASGNVLRTRTFGVMELDDSYPDTSVAITRDLPTDLTCVRSCDWTDQPCGLFVEMNMARIEDHLFHWHGVKLKTKTPCEVEGCKDPDPMVNLGRHIEGIHYATTYQCPYCEKLLSRPDSLKRHVCPPLTVSMTTVEGEGRVFHPLDAKKMVYGYIVPAREAT